MPAHNAAPTIVESAESVLGQTFGDLELLIVDDESSDGTRAASDALAERDPRVRVLRRPGRLGPAAARNVALAEARGRYVAFCDSDDLWLPEKLERQLAKLRETGAALTYSAYHRIAPDFTGGVKAFEPAGRVVRVPATLRYDRLLYRNDIGCLTAVLDTEQVSDPRMPDTAGAEDWALWLSILREGKVAVGVQEPLALYRTSQPQSHSSRRWRAVKAVWRVLREQEGLGRVNAAFHITVDAVTALRKSLI
jgi:teichuronic acid biosynthesis glycosyltransferase TuaG